MRAVLGEYRAPAWRVWVLAIAFSACSLVIVTRLYTLQVAHHDRFRTLADDEQVYEQIIHPKRGALLDAGGRPLAITVMYDNLYAYGPGVTDPTRTAAALAPLLEMRQEEILAKIDRER